MSNRIYKKKDQRKTKHSVNDTTPNQASSDYEQILQLQRTIGNQATQQFLKGETVNVSVPAPMPILRMAQPKMPDTSDTSDIETANQTDKAGNIQRTPKIKQKLSPRQLALKQKQMHLDFVRMKRHKEHIGEVIKAKLGMKVKEREGGLYGHWWVEVGDRGPDGSWSPYKSYGWWPSEAVSIKSTFKGVPGELNAGETLDPHHGETSDEEFHPTMTVDDSEDYDTIRDRIEGQIDNFANGFSGSWNWRLGWGKNCHTFQMRMKKALNMHHQKSKNWLIDPEAGNRDRTTVFDLAGTKDPVETKTAEFDIPASKLNKNNELVSAGSLFLGQTVGFTDLVIKFGGKDYYEVKTDEGDYLWVEETFAKEDMMWSESYD